MKTKWTAIFFGLLLTASCCKEETPHYKVDDQGVFISLPYQWRYGLHESGTYHTTGCFKEPIIFENTIAVPTTDIYGEKRMTMVRCSDGKDLWHWNDIYQGTPLNLEIFRSCQHNNLIAWQDGPWSYCVDLSNGSTRWKFERDQYFDMRLNKFGSKFFTTSIIPGHSGFDESIAFTINFDDGELDEFLRANLSGEYAAPSTNNGFIGGIIYINEVDNSKSKLLVTYTEPLPEWKLRMMFGLYDTETQEWVYERKQLVEPHWNAGVQSSPIIYNGRVYAAAGSTIVCHDVMTGEQIWRRNFTGDFMFSGFIIEEDRVIANCEDMTLYVLRPETGAIIWSLPGAGTSSRMAYYNGVVYFVGGTTTRLHAVDMKQRRTVWLIDASYLEDNSSGFNPTNAVYVIPGKGGGKGRVIALSAYNAYCFETYR